MEWTPDQQALGGLGLAGVCRETCRVIRRAMLPNFVNLGPPLLSALLLATPALCSRVLADLHDHDEPLAEPDRPDMIMQAAAIARILASTDISHLFVTLPSLPFSLLPPGISPH